MDVFATSDLGDRPKAYRAGKGNRSSRCWDAAEHVINPNGSAQLGLRYKTDPSLLSSHQSHWSSTFDPRRWFLSRMHTFQRSQEEEIRSETSGGRLADLACDCKRTVKWAAQRSIRWAPNWTISFVVALFLNLRRWGKKKIVFSPLKILPIFCVLLPTSGLRPQFLGRALGTLRLIGRTNQHEDEHSTQHYQHMWYWWRLHGRDRPSDVFDVNRDESRSQKVENYSRIWENLKFVHTYIHTYIHTYMYIRCTFCSLKIRSQQ